MQTTGFSFYQTGVFEGKPPMLSISKKNSGPRRFHFCPFVSTYAIYIVVIYFGYGETYGIANGDSEECAWRSTGDGKAGINHIHNILTRATWGADSDGGRMKNIYKSSI